MAGVLEGQAMTPARIKQLRATTAENMRNQARAWRQGSRP
jgi:hypothetical protein